MQNFKGKFHPRTFPAHLQAFLIFALTLQLSGLFQASALAAESLSETAQAVSSDPLMRRMQVLIRRARHPGSPGTRGGIPDRLEVMSAQRDVLERRNEIEGMLKRSDPPLSVDTKLTLVTDYLNLATTLTTLHVALDLPHDSRWREQLALRVSRATLRDLPGLGAPTENALGARYYPMTVDRGADGKADPVKLKVSDTLVQGIEAAGLIRSVTDDSYLTLIQYLAVQQLYQNLAALKFLKADGKVTIPKVPAALVKKLDAMRMGESLFQDQVRLIENPAFLEALGSGYKSLRSSMPRFVTQAYARQVSSIIMEKLDPSVRTEAIAQFEAVLRDVEENDFHKALEQELSASPSFNDLSREETISTLRYLVANAQGLAQFDRLIDMMSEGLLRLEQDQTLRIGELIEQRRAEFARSLSDQVLSRWLSVARASQHKHLHQEKREEFIRKLIDASHSLHGRLSARTETVNPVVLGWTAIEHMSEKGLLPSMLEWTNQLVNAESYVVAQEIYTQLMLTLTGPDVLDHGLVSPKRVERFLRWHRFVTDFEFSDDLPPAMRRGFESRINQDRKKSIRDLILIGELMGFHKRHASGSPSVAEVLDNRKRLDTYYKMKKEFVLQENELLNFKVRARLSTGQVRTLPLYRILLSHTQGGVSDAASVRRVTPFVDFVLNRMEKRIASAIAAVSNASSLEEVEGAVRSSLMQALTLQGFPAFQLQADRFLESLTDTSLSHQIMRRYVRGSIDYGFSALILIHVSRWITKRTPFKGAYLAMRYIGRISRPLEKGFMMAITAPLGLDLGHTMLAYGKLKGSYRRSEHLSYTSVDGKTLINLRELEDARSPYQVQKYVMMMRVPIDLPLIAFYGAWPGAKKLMTLFRARDGRIRARRNRIQTPEERKLKELMNERNWRKQ